MNHILELGATLTTIGIMLLKGRKKEESVEKKLPLLGEVRTDAIKPTIYEGNIYSNDRKGKRKVRGRGYERGEKSRK